MTTAPFDPAAIDAYLRALQHPLPEPAFLTGTYPDGRRLALLSSAAT